MTFFNSLEHSSWECKYHIVFIPKKRKTILYGKIKYFLGKALHFLAKQKECKIECGTLKKDHVHMLVSIPPKISISQFVGFIKGKSAIMIAKKFSGITRNFNGESFWARGYHVSTVGYEENKIKNYIEKQRDIEDSFKDL